MKAKQIKAAITARRKNVKHLTLKAIRTALSCKERGDWAEMRNTRLYNLNSVCYCLMLEVIAAVTE